MTKSGQGEGFYATDKLDYYQAEKEGHERKELSREFGDFPDPLWVLIPIDRNCMEVEQGVGTFTGRYIDDIIGE